MPPGTAPILPELLNGPHGLIVRRWVPGDAEALTAAIAESIEHLRPWMPWASEEPVSVDRRRAMIGEWERDWARGGDVILGILLAGRIVGGCGLHHRIGAQGLEIGYWIHPVFLRRGLATQAAHMLTEAAFSVPVITRVEIHHDKANRASEGVPRKLGFRLVDEAPDEPAAPAESGICCRWRVDRTTWARRAGTQTIWS